MVAQKISTPQCGLKTAEKLPEFSLSKEEESAEPIHVPPGLSKEFLPKELIIPAKEKRTGYRPKVKKPMNNSLLKMGELLKGRWKIEGLIGCGGFGQVYLGLDLKDQNQLVAIKAEPLMKDDKVNKRVILEQKALCRLQGRVHVPRMIASGRTDINFIVLQLLSQNLADLKKASPIGKLGQPTTARILLQAVAALRDMHSAGFLHRDVKPANMCFGVTKYDRHILKLVDFGMVRVFKDEYGYVKPGRIGHFRGTARYASSRVHASMLQSPPDDLSSLAYSAAEFLLGDVPWKSLNGHRNLFAAKKKFEDPTSSELGLLPEPFKWFCLAIFSLEPNDEPHYDSIQNILYEVTMHKGLSAPYDWEEMYRDPVEEYGGCVDDNLIEVQFN